MDAWAEYRQAVHAAQADMQAACAVGLTEAQAIRDAAVKPAEAAFEAKRAAAWERYRARCAAEDGTPADAC
jgi:hypothetical protein